MKVLTFAIFFALFAVCFPLAEQVMAGQAAPAKNGFVCPPCGCGRDNEVHDEAGNCPACGMALVERGGEAARPAPQSPQSRRRNAAILLFPGVQIIDYTGPYEVFGQAGFNVYTVAEKPDMLTTAMGMKVTPNYTLEDAPTADVLVIPGGDVTATQENARIIKWIQEESKNAEHVLSVCNGAYILAKTGLLDGMSATTFYGLLDGLRAIAPKVNVVNDRRYVDNGKFITTAGLSSGIDGSLYVISKMVSKARAQMVALNMEYNWQPDSTYARASFADMHLQAVFGRGLSFPVPEGAELRVLSTEGGKDSWEVNWQLQTDTSPSGALKLVDDRLSAAANWSRQTANTAGAATTRWRFTDKKGGQWTALTSAQPVAGQTNRFNLTIRIERAS